MAKKKSDMEKLSNEFDNLSELFNNFKEKLSLDNFENLSISELLDFINDEVPKLQKDIIKIEKTLDSIQEYLEKIEESGEGESNVESPED